MGRPAARRGDPELCPATETWNTMTPGGTCSPPEATTMQKPHVGGLVASGSPNVNVNGRKAVRCGDRTFCPETGSPGLLVTGTPMVTINGQFAVMLGSRNDHGANVTAGSENVFYGGALKGATFGDGAAAERACKEAAKGRKKGQQQGLDMNCGHESVRQLCIQRCEAEGPTSKACDACTKDENEWYRKYLEDQKVKDHYRPANTAEAAAVRGRNDARWAEITSQSNVWHVSDSTSGTVETDKLGSWESHQGETYKLSVTDKRRITIERLPPDLDGDVGKLASEGRVGSSPPARQQMLKEWCGIEDARVKGRGNTSAGIGEEIANGNLVIASVDVNRLKDPKSVGPEAPHAVTVSQVTYDEEGRLKEVKVNDTSRPDGCGVTYPGSDFEKALTKDGDAPRATNVIRARPKP